MGHLPVHVAVISRSHVTRAGMAHLVGQLDTPTVVSQCVSLDEVEDPASIHLAIVDTTDGTNPSRDDDLERLRVEGAAVAMLIAVRRETADATLTDGVTAITLTVSPEQLQNLLEGMRPDGQRVGGRSPMDRATGLTEREFEIVELIAHGMSNIEIARKLFLSINSVKTYIRSAYRRMGVTSRSHAILWAIEHGLVGTPPPQGQPGTPTATSGPQKVPSDGLPRVPAGADQVRPG